MAVKLNQDTLFKYADKACLGLALVFLIIAAAWLLLGKQQPGLTYSKVEQAYRSASERQQEADQHLDDLLQHDPALPLIENTPPYYEMFRKDHETKPSPAWITKAEPNRWATYRAVREAATAKPPQVDVPVLDLVDASRNRRVAPTGLATYADKGYRPSDKETQGILGTDCLFVVGEARLDVAQQMAWNSEAAHADRLTKWQNLPPPVFSDVELERSTRLADGAWSAWEPRPGVRYQDVHRGAAPPAAPQDGDPKILYKDAKARDKRDKFKAQFKLFQDTLAKPEVQTVILRPPFYPLAGKDWIAPFDKLQITPPAGGSPAAQPPAAPAEGNIFSAPPATGAAPAEGAVPGHSNETNVWFNDILELTDIGKTFRYRLRIKFLNPIFGAEADEINADHPEDAWKVQLAGAWSDPQHTLTIEPLVKFFFTGRFGDQTTFTLFRWAYGRWHETKAKALVGDLIAADPAPREDIEVPGPNGTPIKTNVKRPIDYDAAATVVDALDATVRVGDVDRRTVKLIFLDHLTNRLGVRLSVIDQDDAIRFGTEAHKATTVAPPAPLPMPMPGVPLTGTPMPPMPPSMFGPGGRPLPPSMFGPGSQPAPPPTPPRH